MWMSSETQRPALTRTHPLPIRSTRKSHITIMDDYPKIMENPTIVHNEGPTKDSTTVHNEGPTKDVTQARMTESRMQAALLRENPRVFRKSFLKLYGCLFIGYLCSATNGFDSNTFGKLPQT